MDVGCNSTLGSFSYEIKPVDIANELPNQSKNRLLTKEELQRKENRRLSSLRASAKRINLGRSFDRWERNRHLCGMSIPTFIDHLLTIHDSHCTLQRFKPSTELEDHRHNSHMFEPSAELEDHKYNLVSEELMNPVQQGKTDSPETELFSSTDRKENFNDCLSTEQCSTTDQFYDSVEVKKQESDNIEDSDDDISSEISVDISVTPVVAEQADECIKQNNLSAQESVNTEESQNIKEITIFLPDKNSNNKVDLPKRWWRRDKRFRMPDFFCRYCSYKTKNKGNLRVHTSVRHGFVAIACKKTKIPCVEQEIIPTVQLAETRKDKTYSCKYCIFKTIDFQDFLLHVDDSHGFGINVRNNKSGKTYSCKHCSFRSKWITDLISHMKSHGSVAKAGKKTKISCYNLVKTQKGLSDRKKDKVDQTVKKIYTMSATETRKDLIDEKEDKFNQTATKIYMIKKPATETRKDLIDEKGDNLDQTATQISTYMNKSIKDKIFSCEYCPFETKAIVTFLLHMKSRHGFAAKPHERTKLSCYDQFKANKGGSGEKEDHKKQTATEIQKCTDVNKSASSQTYSCKHCTFETISLESYHLHNKSHEFSNDVMYLCEYCPFQTSTRESSLLHMESHGFSNDQSYSCKDCAFQTVSKNDFSQHIKCHEGFSNDKGIMKEKYGTDYSDNVENKVVSTADLLDQNGQNVEVRQKDDVIANIKKEIDIPQENDFDFLLSKEEDIGIDADNKESIGKDFDEWIKDNQLSSCEDENKQFLEKRAQTKHVSRLKVKCDSCSFVAFSKKALRVHHASHDHGPSAATKCPIEHCPYVSISYYSMVKHAKQEHDFCITDIKAIKMKMMPKKCCSLCSYSSFNKSSLTRHYFEKHQLEECRPTHLCSICNYGFYTEKGKVAHEKKGCFICPFGCGRFDKQLTKHMKTVHSDKSYLCSDCGKSYKNANTLKKHIEAKHQDGKNYKCTHDGCGKAFTRSTSLQQHMYIHDREKRLICPVPDCDYRCVQRNAMNWHKKKHSDKEQSYFLKK